MNSEWWELDPVPVMGSPLSTLSFALRSGRG
jgi:hypothetical protein